MIDLTAKFLFILLFFTIPISGQTGIYQFLVSDSLKATTKLVEIEITEFTTGDYKYEIKTIDGKENKSKDLKVFKLVNLKENIFRYQISEKNLFGDNVTQIDSIISDFWKQVQGKIDAGELKKKQEIDEIEKKLKEKEQTIAKLSKRNTVATIKLTSNAKELNLTYKKCNEQKWCGVKDAPSTITNNSFKFKPKNIQIAFENGIIKNIQVIGNINGKKRIFSNTKLIHMRSKDDYINLNKAGHYQLECKLEKESLIPKCELKQKHTALFNLSDLLFFEIQKLHGSGTYIPMETTISIEVPKDTITIIEGKSMMDNLDMRLYTDITGFNSKSVNGTFQFELKYNLFINTLEWGNSWLILERVSPFLNLSKVGQNNISLTIDKKTTSSMITQFNLLEYSYLFSGIDLNLIKRSGSTVTYSLNLLGGIYRTTLSSSTSDTSIVIRDTISYTRDTTITKTEKTNYTNSWFCGLNLTATVFENRNFNMDFSASLLYTGLFKSEYGITPNSVWIVSFLAGLNYFPDENDRTTAFFFRTRFYKTADNGNNNLNIETGVSLSVPKFFSSFGF